MIKISVIMITYGHEKYIEQAINGVLMQECDFAIELIIANDCSPDNMDEVVQNILQNHNRALQIRYIKHDKNIGMMSNFIFAMQQCKGNFIALCEGDDYWTDPLKLQKQVDFLEENEEFVISCSNCNNVTFDGRFVALFNENEIPKITDVNYILRNKWYMPTASIVFRNNKIELPNWFSEVLNGDYMLCLLLTSNGGLVHYENEVRSDYRLHEQGVSNLFKKDNAFNYSMLYNNKVFNNYSKGRYYSSIKLNVEHYSLNILEQLPVFSKEFWKVLSNLVWFTKSLSSDLLFFLKKRISLKIK